MNPPASLSKMCYNAGTAALISDIPPELVRDMARAEMHVLLRNLSAIVMNPVPLLHGRILHLAYVSGTPPLHPSRASPLLQPPPSPTFPPTPAP